MHLSDIEKAKSHPQFKALVKKRSLFAWRLSFLVVIVYFVFILGLALVPEIFNRVIYGEHTTFGFWVGMGVIVFTIFLTGVYVKKSNNEFDRLAEEIHKESHR